MDDEREPDEVRADLCVERRGGCICLKSHLPYSGDVQALLKEWDFKKYKRASGQLARLWDCLVVVCPDAGAEYDALDAEGVKPDV